MPLTTDLATLSARLAGVSALRSLRDLARGRVGGVPAGAIALIAWWLREVNEGAVVLVGNNVESLSSDAALWGGIGALGLFPAADTPPFDRVPPSEEVTRRRLASLALLAGGAAPLIVASPAGLLRPALPVELVRGATVRLRAGERHPRDAFIRRAVDLGYRRVSAVSVAGEIAVRGGIVDVFGLDRARPWRAEWFGDEVEELRAFDVETQTSVAKLSEVAVWPARELDLRAATVARAIAAVDTLDISRCRPEVREAWERDRRQLGDGGYDEGVDLFYPYLVGEDPTTLLDHAPEDVTVLLAGGREALLRSAQRHAEEIEKLRQQEEDRGELPFGARTGLLSPEALLAVLDRHCCLELVREPDGDLVLDWRGVDGFAGRISAFSAAVRARTAGGATVLAVSRQQHRVEELVRDDGLDPVDLEDFDAGSTELPPGALAVTGGDLSQGFSAGDGGGLDVYSDHELFGAVKRRGSPLARGARRAESTSARGARRSASGAAANAAFVMQFAPGDVVVHRDHGIGRFLEMRTVSDALGEHEYMSIEYADGDKLFVPVDHLDRVDRYVGGAEAHPHLSRLGSGEWERVKRRVKERTEEVARELLALYSRREMADGHAFGPDGSWQRELEASFPYQETPDQEMVLDEIKRDMEASRPMDRVVCGDVGFGKTELALRAAFKAASEGRQVAVLVPTTVLAQQHFLTFTERLAPFPVTVRQLSRFCSDADIAATLVGLRSGAVDIVVGTHRLLQRDVEFRNLGLVVIDEEQRFGVLQKERFKSMRVAVDVLSLSATPIPRTLHMSLAGIRDLSVIQTPPEERQPIKTYVTAREDSLVREVITRELARAGQVFFLDNRVQTIEKHAEELRRLVPEARIAVGHGQMPEHTLAEVMRQFGDGNLDVLVCTTIIESGLDIPNANTIVINDAHRLGLAQLYQLRGRVGRAGQRAYAYLLYPADRSLTEKADKRLDVIGELQDLGAGFKLAMHDLEIRGAGNLLGEEQHGEIAAVGLELYNTLLRQAVSGLQGKPIVESPAQVSVSLPVKAFLPVSYVTDERLRLRCYQELAACASEADLDRAARGLVDRFGPLPDPAELLIYSLRVRLLAAAAGVTAVESGGDGVRVQLVIAHGLDLAAVVEQWRLQASATATRVVISTEPVRRAGEWRDVLTGVLRELGRLQRVRSRAPA
ncbi:MAG: transcription-repair coupling factor [Candidatus Dormibacteraeota bacterium]|uniref:Transcription-repair-coupling factor n=2 Tax=Candidatus Aeolococcaceae TaxID=3127005 RepID=A0A934KNI6_9BACT|nr:transcription-repair coupling factor [Candidatus Dormibacteraeota bacterium]